MAAMAESKSCISQLFNSANADVIVRSSDGVDFRLHKLVLGEASPVFLDMFTLPEQPSQDDESSLPVVDVSEDATTLEDILSFCYPRRRAKLLELSRLRAALQAAQKYDMTFLIEDLKENLTLFIPSEPLRLYAFAHSLEDPTLARAAARRLLEIPKYLFPTEPPPEYHHLPAIALYNAQLYRDKCVAAAQAAFSDNAWILSGVPGRWVSVSRKGNVDTTNSWVWLSCASCSSGTMELVGRNSATGHWGAVRPRAWWEGYYNTVKAQLSERPVGSVAARTDTIRAAVKNSISCSKCSPWAAMDLTEFAEAMAKRIDMAVSEVAIELPF